MCVMFSGSWRVLPRIGYIGIYIHIQGEPHHITLCIDINYRCIALMGEFWLSKSFNKSVLHPVKNTEAKYVFKILYFVWIFILKVKKNAMWCISYSICVTTLFEFLVYKQLANNTFFSIYVCTVQHSCFVNNPLQYRRNNFL